MERCLWPTLLFSALFLVSSTVEACTRTDVVNAYKTVFCRVGDDAGIAYWVAKCKTDDALTEATIEKFLFDNFFHSMCLHKRGDTCLADCVDDCVGSEVRPAKTCNNHGTCVCHKCGSVYTNRPSTCTCSAGYSGASQRCKLRNKH